MLGEATCSRPAHGPTSSGFHLGVAVRAHLHLMLSLLLPCRTCFTACVGCPVSSSAWLPRWLCLSLIVVIGGSRLSSCPVDAAMQVGCGEAAWAGLVTPRVCPFSGFLCQGGFAWGLPVLVTAPGHVLHSQADLGGGCAAGRHRLPQCHSCTFLPTTSCCISERVSLDSCLALTRQVWRGHVRRLHVLGYEQVKNLSATQWTTAP